MDSGWEDKVWKAAYCDGAAQNAIVKLKFENKMVPCKFSIDESVSKEFNDLCERLGYVTDDVLRQLVDSFCDRIRLMQGEEDTNMTLNQQARFSIEVKQDGQIAANFLHRQKKGEK